MTVEVNVVQPQDAVQIVGGQGGQRQRKVQEGKMPWCHQGNSNEPRMGEQI